MSETTTPQKKKASIYLIVFGVIAVIVILAAISSLLFNKNIGAQSVTAANLPILGNAPNIVGIAAWINSPPLNLTQLKGKIVLVDFWTYSCINCIRSIPHLEAWYKAYGKDGLVIIGVHTPEFSFEQNLTNVQNAVKRFNITYPVALDNNYATWDAYGNEYWPADYLIDQNGQVRYVVFGEGDYNTTENAIRALLISAGYTIQPNLTSVPLGVNFSGIGTPELYVGYERARQPIGNPQGFSPNQTVNYTLPSQIQNNTVYLSGSWYNAPDSMIAVNNSKIFLIYKAAKVNVVAGVYGTNATSITMKLDGNNLTSQDMGGDDILTGGQGVATVNSYRLYNIINTSTTYIWHILEIDAQPGFRLYTFTFG